MNLCPWADVVYGCDAAWWRFRRGLPAFKGRKITWDKNGLGPDFPDIERIKIGGIWLDDLVLDDATTIASGGNSGFQALNLAVQFGAKRIILIGFDMSDRNGVHWYGRNSWIGAGNPSETNFPRWINAFARAAPLLAGMGIEVFNTAPNSALKCFPPRSIEDAL